MLHWGSGEGDSRGKGIGIRGINDNQRLDSADHHALYFFRDILMHRCVNKLMYLVIIFVSVFCSGCSCTDYSLSPKHFSSFLIVRSSNCQRRKASSCYAVVHNPWSEMPHEQIGDKCHSLAHEFMHDLPMKRYICCSCWDAVCVAGSIRWHEYEKCRNTSCAKRGLFESEIITFDPMEKSFFWKRWNAVRCSWNARKQDSVAGYFELFSRKVELFSRNLKLFDCSLK